MTPPTSATATTDDLYEQAPCGLLVTSADGLIQRVNRTFCTWMGREASTLVGSTRVQDLLTMGGRIFHQTHWAPLLQIQGSVSEVKLEVVHADGRKLPMVWNVTRRVVEGRIWHELAVFIAEDRNKYEHELVLARRRAEELLGLEQKAQHALRAAQIERDRQQALAEDRAIFAEQMVAIVSHDLRNPLTVIRMGSHLLAMGELSSKQQSALQRIIKSNDRAARLISDLLDFSGGRLGTALKVDIKPIDLHGLVRDGIEDLRLAYPDREIAHVQLGSGECHGGGDRLTQLMVNLVANAVAYGAPDCTVVVTSAIGGTEFSISVHNMGLPIAADFLPRLFDPMTRGMAAVGSTSSVGLGLFIVRAIARAHGGEVAVESSAEGGTTFSASFPRRTAQTSQTSDPPTPEADDERHRQAALDALRINTLQETFYDDIVRLAAEACDAPIALISLVDGDRQWFKSRIGLQASETPREHALCAHAIKDPSQVMIVDDAAVDPRFAANPLVTGGPGIRFYAGAPLVTSTGAALGTVCIMDRKPRTLDSKQLELLRFLAQQVVVKLEGH